MTFSSFDGLYSPYVSWLYAVRQKRENNTLPDLSNTPVHLCSPQVCAVCETALAGERVAAVSISGEDVVICPDCAAYIADGTIDNNLNGWDFYCDNATLCEEWIADRLDHEQCSQHLLDARLALQRLLAQCQGTHQTTTEEQQAHEIIQEITNYFTNR